MNIAPLPKQLKSRVNRLALLKIVGGVVTLLLSNPTTVTAAAGPGGLIALGVLDIIMRNVTTDSLHDK